LTVDLTNLVRGEAVGRFGHERVVRFRVSALPRSAPATADDVDRLVAPFTRLRTDIEAGLRRPSAPPPDEGLPMPEREQVNEGHHDW
jgi:hypothetical protein